MPKIDMNTIKKYQKKIAMMNNHDIINHGDKK